MAAFPPHGRGKAAIFVAPRLARREPSLSGNRADDGR